VIRAAQGNDGAWGWRHTADARVVAPQPLRDRAAVPLRGVDVRLHGAQAPPHAAGACDRSAVVVYMVC